MSEKEIQLSYLLFLTIWKWGEIIPLKRAFLFLLWGSDFVEEPGTGTDKWREQDISQKIIQTWMGYEWYLELFDKGAQGGNVFQNFL